MAKWIQTWFLDEWSNGIIHWISMVKAQTWDQLISKQMKTWNKRSMRGRVVICLSFLTCNMKDHSLKKRFKNQREIHWRQSLRTHTTWRRKIWEIIKQFRVTSSVIRAKQISNLKSSKRWCGVSTKASYIWVRLRRCNLCIPMSTSINRPRKAQSEI